MGERTEQANNLAYTVLTPTPGKSIRSAGSLLSPNLWKARFGGDTGDWLLKPDFYRIHSAEGAEDFEEVFNLFFHKFITRERAINPPSQPSFKWTIPLRPS
jgi:hypothetical protein